jgi:kynurenine aminotransferase
LKKAIADAYSPLWGRKLNPDTEVTITTGANEGQDPFATRRVLGS